MRAYEFITEINYTSGIDHELDHTAIINHSTLDGDIDYQDVWKCESANEQLYFFKSNNQIDAYVIIEKQPTNGYHHLRGIRNVTGKNGYVTALIGYITHRLKKKVKISADEPLSPAGFQWVKSFLLAKGRGLTVTDQDGNFPDITAIEKEWTTHMVANGYGPTEILIESRLNKGPRLLGTKADSFYFMNYCFFLGDETIQ